MSSASRKLIQASGGGGPVDTGDDDFANVVLLLDGDGTSGDDNETFTDSSTNGYTVTEYGTAIQGSFSPYGDNWSNYFDGNDHLNTDAVVFGTSNFTIELWVMFDDASATQNPIIVLGNDGYNDWQLDTASSKIRFQHTSGSFSGATTLQNNTWYHVAVVREGTGTNETKIYLNGVVDATSTVSENFDGTGDIKIARNRGNNYYLSGYISNVRIVKGTAVYTSGYTVPTDPLTAITNTELLTCQSNRFVDESTNNNDITVNGTPKVTPFSPFKDDDARDITTDGGSVFFDGGDHHLAAVPSALGSGNWTVEFWLYLPANPTSEYATLLDWRTFGGSATGVPVLSINTSRQLSWWKQVSGGPHLTTTSAVPLNQWSHIVIEKRNSNTTSIIVDGVSFGQISDSSTYNTETLNVANVQAIYGFSGYICDVRIVVGTALYNASVTRPTAPLSAVTNTELLLNFQDSGIYDRTGINNLDTAGTAQIDTAVKKYGTGSLEFDGSAYLGTVSTEALTFGAGDFTVEFWINTSNNGNIMNPSTATGTGYWGLIIQSGNLRWNNSYAVTNLWEISASAIQDGSWHHVAISRASGSTKIFYDGTLQSTQSDTTNYSGTGAWRIGSGNLAAFNGYLDDFRITKGVARYTASFTAPNAELPKF